MRWLEKLQLVSGIESLSSGSAQLNNKESLGADGRYY